MLLSMFMSFLLARRFHRKAYVFLMAAGLVFTSFFSVGLPHYYSERIIADITESGLLLENPVPLSFPFYASLYFERVSIAHNFRHLGFDKETYQLHFLTLILHDFLVYKRYWGGLADFVFMEITLGHYILFISFFSLVNIVGVIIGYRLSKTTFIEKLFKKRTNQ